MTLYFFMALSILISDSGISKGVINQETNESFYIDYIEVTEEKFTKKLESMKETGDWFCRMTNTGGITGYTCEDSKGKAYRYQCVSDAENTKCSLTRKDRPFKIEIK